MAQQHDHRLAGGGDGFGQRHLRRGDHDVGARLRLARHFLTLADRQHDDVRRLRRCDRCFDAALDRLFDAGSVDRHDRVRIGRNRAHARQQVDRVRIGAIDIPGADQFALPLHERPDQRDLLAGAGQGQQLILILQQHDRPACRVARHLQMRGRAHLRLFPAWVDATKGIVEQTQLGLERQNAPHRLVQPRHRHLARLHQPGQMLHVETRLHRHVDARQESELRRLPLVRRKAVGDQFHVAGIVGHDQAIEAPLVAQNVRQQPVIGGCRHAGQFVERRHDRRRVRVERRLKGGEVDFAQRPFGHIHAVIVQAALGRAIGGEMLGAGRHGVGRAEPGATLEAAYARIRHDAAQQHILTRALDAAAPALVARHIDHRREIPVDPGRRRLHRRHARGPLGQFGVETARFGQGHRKDGAETMDHVGGEDQRNFEAALLRRHHLHLPRHFRAIAVEHAADPAASHIVHLLAEIRA